MLDSTNYVTEIKSAFNVLIRRLNMVKERSEIQKIGQ